MRTVATLSFALAAAVLAMSAHAEAPRVDTLSGPVLGVKGDGFISFKDIPYAAPPVGALRWQKPQPVAAWTKPRDGSDFGASCLAPTPPTHVVPGSRGLSMSEDCLKLNVWTPTAANKAPVMVWIHGGGNINGSPADFFYDGQNFAKDGIVLVSVNYRLGLFGFFAHPALGQTANFGLWDQVEALKWVKANIARFGGDPDNITLFGESAGGQDTLALMAAPAARGLFKRAIAESAGGGWGPNTDLADTQKSGVTTAAGFGLTNATPEQLRALPADDVVKATGDLGDVIVDHDLLPESPLAAFADKTAAQVPLIIGTNSEEGSLIGRMADPRGVFPNLTGDDIDKLRTLYGETGKDNIAFTKAVFRDGYFTGPSRFVARSSGAWLYRFSYVLAPLQAKRTGAWHGSEIPFIFERWPINDLNDDDHRVEGAMHACWAAFAKTGRPDCANAPDWQPYTTSGKQMLFDAHPSARVPDDQPAVDLLDSKLAPKFPK